MRVICPYCGDDANLESSSKIYNGKDFGKMYVCENYPKCDSYVGVHEGTVKPLGFLANRELREIRKKAHAAFDPLWKSKKMKRVEAYRWLAQKLGI